LITSVISDAVLAGKQGKQEAEVKEEAEAEENTAE
jgi:small subunit ribosomal protein S2